MKTIVCMLVEKNSNVMPGKFPKNPITAYEEITRETFRFGKAHSAVPWNQ